MSADESAPLTYKTAGVDIDAGTALVERIKGIAGKTRIPGVLAGIGGFASLFELPLERYRQPVLVAATDGVGTKLKLAGALGRHDTIGIDLVAMCVNDIVVQGATPLFFLDYFSTGKLSVELAAQVIEGIGEGCRRAGIALVGGETAEMPGMYGSGEYDLAGFCVGLVEKGEILDGSRVCAGDRLIGVASSGPHSNGYSLIRKIMERESASLEEPVGGKTLGQLLIEPTRIYVKPLLQLLRDVEIHAMAHITGGGMGENLPRVLPEGLSAAIDLSAWERPAIFRWLQQRGRIEESEMLRTFNCGIGMILCVPPQDEAATLSGLAARGEGAVSIGSIVAAEGKTPIRFLTGARGARGTS